MPRVPDSAAGRELWSLIGRDLDSFSAREWADLQGRWRVMLGIEPATRTPEAFPLDHLILKGDDHA